VSSIVGIGYAPEGIEENPVMYELLLEWTWRTASFDLKNWTDQRCRRRYE
jgi:alpha-N-acetylglucosaminidase